MDSDGAPGSFEVFDKVVRVNLVGAFNVMRVAAAAMLASGAEDGEHGVIVNTASVAAFDGQVGQAAYSASKAGLVAMALPIARELAGRGIRVNTIAPGLFETPMQRGIPERVLDRMRPWILEPARMGRPGEFAALVRHTIENPYLNAECIRIDAGWRPNTFAARTEH